MVTPTGCWRSTKTATPVNGDVIMAIVAPAWKEQGKLKNNTVVATVMSNLGFRQAMEAAGINPVTTKVGDRYVLEAMIEHRAILGGEQSGHVIYLDKAMTGDGLPTAIRLLDVVAGTGKASRTLAAGGNGRIPQVLRMSLSAEGRTTRPRSLGGRASGGIRTR